MKVYYDKDTDLSLIKGKNVAIVGYGSQGHAHALNLHDSGCKVTVAVRKNGASWVKAEKAGLKVAEIADAVKVADVVMILLPDEQIADVYNKDGSGWQMGTTAPSIPATDPFAGSQQYGVNEWESQYAPAPPADYSWSGNNPAAWGFNADPWAGDFGAGRYADSTTNPYSTAYNQDYVPGSYVGTSIWDEMFGPMARFVSGDPNNTD
jgi:hypothetical protein